MDTSYWKLGVLLKLPKPTLLAGVLLALALVALACAPAEEPTATSAPAAVVEEEEVAAMEEEEVAAMEEEVAAVEEPATAGEEAEAVVQALTGFEQYQTGEGAFIERAGLQIWVPEGFDFGGPIIPPDPREPQYGGVVVRGASGDPPSVDPYHTTSTFMNGVVAMTYERLIHLPVGPGVDPFVDIRLGGLAESWEWGDDFLSLKFNLRQGVNYQDVAPVNGREVDSEDVKSSFDLLSGPESVNKGFFANVDRVETPDKYTAIYHMNQVDLNIFAVLSDPGRGFIIPRELGSGTTFNRRLSAIGTGGFMPVTNYEYKLGIDLVRNPNFWEKDAKGNQMPYLDGIKIRIVGDAAARTAAFRTGKIDFGNALSTPDNVREILRTNPSTILQEYTVPYSTANTGFRLDKEPWSDVRVRRAMSLAIDWEVVSQTVWGVTANPWVGIPGAWYGEATNDLATLNANTSGNWYSYDPERAKALLAEAGYPDGFETSLEYYPYSPSHTESHELKAAFWSDIGVDVQIKSLDYSVFRANLDNGAWTDIGGWTFIFPYPSSMEGQVLDLIPGKGQNENTGHINDSVLTDLVNQLFAAYDDEDERRDLMKQIRMRYLDQVYSLPWPSGHGYISNSPRLRNFQSRNSALVSNDNRYYNHIWIDDSYAFE